MCSLVPLSISIQTALIIFSHRLSSFFSLPPLLFSPLFPSPCFWVSFYTSYFWSTLCLEGDTPDWGDQFMCSCQALYRHWAPLTVIHKSTTPQHCAPRLYSTACSMTTGVQTSQHLAQPATLVGGTSSPEHKGESWMGDRYIWGRATWERSCSTGGLLFQHRMGRPFRICTTSKKFVEISFREKDYRRAGI